MSDNVQHPKNLSKEIIQHLSKEIETLTNNNMIFRSRASLSVFLGPFVVLGSFVIALKGTHISFHLNNWTWVAVAFAILGYWGLAYMSGVVEEHAWSQCNKNRDLIARLHESPQSNISFEELRVKYKARRAYVITYSFMLVIFISAVYIVSGLKFTDLQPAHGKLESTPIRSPMSSKKTLITDQEGSPIDQIVNKKDIFP